MLVLPVMTVGPMERRRSRRWRTEPDEDKHRLTALEGLAALSLDALSSVAYGPQAIVIVLAAAGAVGAWTTRCRSRSRSWCCWPCW